MPVTRIDIETRGPERRRRSERPALIIPHGTLHFTADFRSIPTMAICDLALAPTNAQASSSTARSSTCSPVAPRPAAGCWSTHQPRQHDGAVGLRSARRRTEHADVNTGRLPDAGATRARSRHPVGPAGVPGAAPWFRRRWRTASGHRAFVHPVVAQPRHIAPAAVRCGQIPTACPALGAQRGRPAARRATSGWSAGRRQRDECRARLAGGRLPARLRVRDHLYGGWCACD